MTDGMHVELTGNERNVLAGLLRSDVRKTERGIEQGRRKWGAEYDDRPNRSRIALLEECYRKLGGAPERITNR